MRRLQWMRLTCPSRFENISFTASAICARHHFKDWRAQLESARDDTYEKCGSAAALGHIDDKAFFGFPFAQAPLRAAERRIKRALAQPGQLSVWTNWLVAHQECIENGLSSILKAFGAEP